MLNTVLASQVTSKACHLYKETAQPEEKKGDRQSGSQPMLSFFHPPPFLFFYFFYCDEGAGDTETHAIRGPRIMKQGCAGQFV